MCLNLPVSFSLWKKKLFKQMRTTELGDRNRAGVPEWGSWGLRDKLTDSITFGAHWWRVSETNLGAGRRPQLMMFMGCRQVAIELHRAGKGASSLESSLFTLVNVHRVAITPVFTSCHFIYLFFPLSLQLLTWVIEVEGKRMQQYLNVIKLNRCRAGG